jgi:hypothetical protein
VYSNPKRPPYVVREANSLEIRSWSFGAVIKRRSNHLRDWRDRKGTLDDEAIFGPTVDFQCSCQKYSGKQYADYVCDVCGVKITSRLSRRTRFGHIELSVAMTHDVCGGVGRIDAFPVLPGHYRNSARGRSLDSLYEQMLSASNSRDADSMYAAYSGICTTLGSPIMLAAEWGLGDIDVLVRGIGCANTTALSWHCRV